MDLIKGLQEAFRRDADALKQSIQTERQWCLDAFIALRPILAAAVEDTQQALMDSPVPSKHREAAFHYAVNALGICDNRIRCLREGMADLAARETKET